MLFYTFFNIDNYFRVVAGIPSNLKASNHYQETVDVFMIHSENSSKASLTEI
jgi:hypothetical protein